MIQAQLKIPVNKTELGTNSKQTQMALVSSVSVYGISARQLSCFTSRTGSVSVQTDRTFSNFNIFSLSHMKQCFQFNYFADTMNLNAYNIGISKRTQPYRSFQLSVKMCSVSTENVPVPFEKSKRVWIWTESKQVMCSAVERGWNTFIFSPQNQELASHWSCGVVYSFFLGFWIGISLLKHLI